MYNNFVMYLLNGILKGNFTKYHLYITYFAME